MTREEVLKFLASVRSIKHRTILTTCYAAGLRISEAICLKVTDIDSERMVIRILQGKGAKDGSVATLQACRDRLVGYAPHFSVSGLFKWRQFEPEVILLAIGWYLRFSLSYRDVEELLAERACALTTSPSGDGSSGCSGTGAAFAPAPQADERLVGGWTRPTCG